MLQVLAERKEKKRAITQCEPRNRNALLMATDFAADGQREIHTGYSYGVFRNFDGGGEFGLDVTETVHWPVLSTGEISPTTRAKFR